MEQYIPKSSLVSEIEALISNGKLKCQQSKENGDRESYVAWSEHIATCGKILSFINTLEVKEADLEKVFNDEYSKFSNDIDADYAFPIDLADYKDFAKHFFELGLNKIQKGE